MDPRTIFHAQRHLLLIARWVVGAALLGAPIAAAQPVCSLASNAGGADGGWVGERSQLLCSSCPGCEIYFLEIRPTAGTYGGLGSFQRNIDVTQYTLLDFAYVHLRPYQWRMTGKRLDGGVLTATTPERPVTADTVFPGDPGVPMVSELDGGSFRLTFAPSVDNGSGIALYDLLYALAIQPAQYVTGDRKSVV